MSDNEHKWKDGTIGLITSLKLPSYSMRHAFMHNSDLISRSMRYRTAISRAESLGIDLDELFDCVISRGCGYNIDIIEDELDSIDSLQQLNISMSGSLLLE